MADEIKYERKTVQTVRGTARLVISKMQKEGWEYVDQTTGTVRTSLNFRRPKKPVPRIWVAAAAAGAVLLATVIAVGAVREGDEGKPQSDKPTISARDSKSAAPQATETPTPTVKPKPKRFLVTRVADGDTVELGNGQQVRVVGIDTPEQGQCGYEVASNHMADLVLLKQVSLTTSDEDTDRYGRLLRYVNVNDIDAGLNQIRSGFAIARYDSRDGYGRHPREDVYIRADKKTRQFKCEQPTPLAEPTQQGDRCHPGYSEDVKAGETVWFRQSV